MEMDLEKVKRVYSFKVKEFYCGEDVVTNGKCSRWARKKELKDEKDVIYVKVHVSYQGSKKQNILYHQFHLEDSEGYFVNATPPDDYLDATLSPGGEYEGGLLFSLYQDVKPSRLWFDTGILFEDSRETIFLDIYLPIPTAETRTQFLAKEELMKGYTQEISRGQQILEGGRQQIEAETLVNEISQVCGIPYKKIEGGYLFKILLSDSRKQNVLINFTGKDDENTNLITIATICAHAQNDKNDRSFLTMNPKLPYGAIGISNINGQDFYVITDAFPSSIADKELILKAIKSIASKGDWIEKHLTGGKDIR